jgi:hypothetical protein
MLSCSLLGNFIELRDIFQKYQSAFHEMSLKDGFLMDSMHVIVWYLVSRIIVARDKEATVRQRGCGNNQCSTMFSMNTS